MNDISNFKLWLTENKEYSAKTIGNIVSRLKRADSILPWTNDTVYLFLLGIFHKVSYSKITQRLINRDLFQLMKI